MDVKTITDKHKKILVFVEKMSKSLRGAGLGGDLANGGGLQKIT